MTFKITSFGKNAKRRNYNKNDLSSLKINLNRFVEEDFNYFLNTALPKLFESYFPVYATDKKHQIVLKKLDIGKPRKTYQTVKNELGSYTFPINLDLLLKIQKSDIEIPAGKIAERLKNDPVKVLNLWLKQRLNFTQPVLIAQNNNVYSFTDEKKLYKNKLLVTVTIKKQKAEYWYLDLNLKKRENVFFGEYPYISHKGSFLINGNEKVIVMQLVRAPGVYFAESISQLNKVFKSEIIPNFGTWMDCVIRHISYKKLTSETNQKALPIFEIILNKQKSNNVLISNLFTILGLEKKVILDLLNHHEVIVGSYQHYRYESEIVKTVENVYSKLFNPNKGLDFQEKLQTILDQFFTDRKFHLGQIGRYKINRKLSIVDLLFDRVLATDLIDEKTQKLVIKKGTLITKEYYHILTKFFNEDRNHLVALKFDKKLIKSHNLFQTVQVYEDNYDQKKVINLIGVDSQCQSETLTVVDLVVIVAYTLNLSIGAGQLDDIDSLSNRYVKTLCQLLINRFQTGLNKTRNDLIRKLNDLTINSFNNNEDKIVNLINLNFISGTVKDFFNTSQLSQFLDQTNPLTELSNKRRITILGESGLKRESASSKIRDIHSSFLGKICPIETPEGPNIGLITNLAFNARINKFGFIETPYRQVINGRLTNKIVYLSALDEKHALIAPATTKFDDQGQLINEYVIIYFNDNLTSVPRNKVEYIGYSTEQMFSAPTASIPFLENNDANRALMGANMQKQAVPLIQPDSPIVATGTEHIVARDSGFAIVARNAGKVTYADSQKIEILNENAETDVYYLDNFLPSNQKTALYHSSLVKIGDQIAKQQIIADGAAIDNGELAIGKNLLVAFTTWKGYNYEDALIISERLVRENVLSSVHVYEYEIRRLRTKLGDEEFTTEIPNTSQNARRLLDENGIVVVGSEILPGDILVGKVTPRDKGQITPEDRLLNQLFRGREQNVENSSLTVATGDYGIVQRVQRYSSVDYDITLNSDVIEIIKVFVARKIPIQVGDKIASRHGNKGVISQILPENSMPFLADGTPVDILINPLGVPSRMNVGQLLEMHFGYAAHKLNVKIATPIFNGASKQDLKAIMQEANVDLSGKEFLYDGETGLPFDQKVAVGILYYLKLSHMVNTKIHARNVGPYTLITQQPLKGKAQNGGQRFGEMEVWALESYGAAHNLRELLTIKSDDIIGRNRIYNNIINGKIKNFYFENFPESFNVLMAEMKGLCLNTEIININKNDFTNKEPQ